MCGSECTDATRMHRCDRVGVRRAPTSTTTTTTTTMMTVMRMMVMESVNKSPKKTDKPSDELPAARSAIRNGDADGGSNVVSGGGSGGSGGCVLGIDERTGRLQWCPGYRFVRILFVIPAAMLPIALLFLLLSRFQVVGSEVPEHAQQRGAGCGGIGYFADGNELADDDVLSGWSATDQRINAERCLSLATGAGEEQTDPEADRGLLRHILRTSFVPPIPEHGRLPGCQHTGLRDNAPDASQDDVPDVPDDTAGSVPHNGTKASRRVKKSLAWRLVDSKSPESIRAAQVEIMRKHMDERADPCQDFYQYACGNWDQVNPIPKDKAALDTFELLRESLDLVLKNLLLEGVEHDLPELPDIENTLGSTTTTPVATAAAVETTAEQLHRVRKRIPKRMPRAVQNKLIIRSTQVKRVRKRRQLTTTTERDSAEEDYEVRAEDEDAETKARHLFVSCMNYAQIEQRGLEPLHALLASLGGWPVLDPAWDARNFDWLNLTAHVRRYNNDILIVQWVGPDIKNSDENIVQFDQTSLGLPTRDYYLQPANRKYLDAYRQFMIEVIELLGVPTGRARQATDEMLEFEIQLANITNPPEERNNVSTLYRKMILEHLQDEIPEIDWSGYLKIVTDRPVNSSEFVVMFALTYMHDLVELIEQTEPRIVANYILWRFVRHRINNLDDRFLGAKQRFSNALFGREKNPPRWKNCVTQVNANMGMAVGAMFVRRYFDETSKRDTLTMTHELQQAFRELLNQTEWIDGPTKRLAEQKVNAMSLRIGYPDFILSPGELNSRYAGLSVHPERYFENTLNVLSHIRRTDQEKLGQPVNKTVWHTAPAVVNAYYSRNKNQIMFPAGILQPPFYHRHFPKSINYGGIGVVIGHELTHGFDDKGRLFDHDGNLYRWWSDGAIEAFHERAACLVQQYGKYTIDEIGVQLDGENTQGENIADNGGIKQAFLAYTRWLEAQTDPRVLEQETLPGLNVTNRQLFFLNFAQIWCGAMRPEATRSKLKTAVHSPGRFRVIGTLSNSEDFAREFNCPIGSIMNPVEKCSVW
ncbi:neprilysin-4-like [Anopheles darlingi]|uniref:neprilysin-4-like n=1 Tax=Anopheles darlingi TaxID=43151 RepID=UPI00210064C0|nr:neprilysin-4-like [Anopheles darlingi]